MTAAMALAAAAVPSSVHAQSAAAPVPLLDVPFLPQSEALCGGAAVAMVMRYWGRTGVYAETFSDLVDDSAGGIRGHELIRALEERGFDATTFEGNIERILSALRMRYPPIVLIEDRPGRFHYVVIVGVRGDQIVMHDPARAPFRLVALDAFARAWSVSRYWTLTARPAIATEALDERELSDVERVPSGAERRVTGKVCSGMVDEGIRLAGAGEVAGAERVLTLAAAACERDPAPWRELAGVRALRGEWTEAARDARRALDRDPHDAHAARILATSLFLEGQDEAALDAWNRSGAPVVDIVDIRGLERTRFAVAAEMLDLQPQTLLTRPGLARARKRLAALPSLQASRITYEPGEADQATVVASVLERPLVPTGLIPIGATVLRVASDRELAVRVASPAGGGELWTGSWRWWERRPRVAVAVAAPSPIGGVWSLEAFAERQTYGAPGAEFAERRRGVLLQASDWMSGTTKIEMGGAVDRWTEGATGSIHGSLTQVFGSGRGTSRLAAGYMFGVYRAGLMDAAGEWQSSLDRVGSTWQLRAGFSTVASGAPLALWPGAGTGHGRDVLLRAHPLIDDGVIRGIFGRRLVHAGGEWRYWRGPFLRSLHVAPAAFVDVARALEVPAFGDGRTHVDAGAGIRVAIPGAGVLRLDLAKGLRDGATSVAVGWGR